MKKLILIFVFTMLSNYIFSQQTYLKRLSFNYQNQNSYFHPEDSVLNFRNYSQYNGYSFIHFDNNRDDSKIAKLDSIGNILWSIGATHQGSTGLTWFNGLKGTSDGGCVYLSSDYWGLSGNYTASLVKYDTNGNLEWFKSVPQNYDSTVMIYYQTTYSLALTGNDYACLATDSIYLFDTSGAVIGNINYKGPGELIGFANEDLFLISNTLNARIDRQGNVRYTLSGTVLNYDTTLYLLIGDTLHQIEGMTGAYISSIYFPSSGTGKMLMLKDGGWIRYSQNTITCLDSMGFQKWSRNFPLPRFGINLVAEQRDGTLLTGGTYISLDGVFGGTQDYSFFISTLDTAGLGIVDSFTQLFVGDADIDNIYEYSDAIYIALSQGSAGPARNDSSTGSLTYLLGVDLSPDYSQNFNYRNINYKFCDIDGDGTIATNDINMAMPTFLTPFYNPGRPYRYRNNDLNSTSSQNTLPFFSCLPVRDSAITGDTIRFYFILGNNGVLIDSIFGLCFQLSFDSSYTFDIGKPVRIAATNSQVGNLNDLQFHSNFGTGLEIGFLLARKDLQNVFNIADTIGYVDVKILDSTSGNIDLLMRLASFKAITKGGYPIDFQFNTRPVHLRSGITEVTNINVNKISIYPNPADERIHILNMPVKNGSIRILSVDGRVLLNTTCNEISKSGININNLAKGTYIISIIDENNFSFQKAFIKN